MWHFFYCFICHVTVEWEARFTTFLLYFILLVTPLCLRMGFANIWTKSCSSIWSAHCQQNLVAPTDYILNKVPSVLPARLQGVPLWPRLPNPGRLPGVCPECISAAGLPTPPSATSYPPTAAARVVTRLAQHGSFVWCIVNKWWCMMVESFLRLDYRISVLKWLMGLIAAGSSSF